MTLIEADPLRSIPTKSANCERREQPVQRAVEGPRGETRGKISYLCWANGLGVLKGHQTDELTPIVSRSEN